MAKLNTKIVMLKGEQGKDGTTIKSVEKSASSGLVDTYTITLTNGAKFSFNVTNGNGIKSIAKTGTNGLVDTYTITYNDGTTSTFTVTNGEGVQNLQIGGRNLIKDSKGETIVSNSTLTEVTRSYFVTNEEGLIGDNTTVTISADIKTNGHVVNTEFILMDGNFKNISSKKFYNLPTTYTRLSVTFTTLPPHIGEDWSKVYIRFDNNSTDSEGTEALLYIRNPKLEIGNIATGWTPAPEDLPYTSITNSEIDTILNS